MKNVPISIEEYKIKYSQDSLNSLYINLALNVRLYKEANRLTWGSFSAKGLYLDEIKVDILNHAKAIFVLITYIKELEKNNTTVHIADFREFYIEFVLKPLILRKEELSQILYTNRYKITNNKILESVLLEKVEERISVVSSQLDYLMSIIKEVGAIFGDTIDENGNSSIFKTTIEKGMEEETFLTRLVKERDELKDRLDKLDNFLMSDKAKEIDPIQRDLLQIQSTSMNTYLTCLETRLGRLNKS